MASPACADDPVVNYVRVSVDSDQHLNCNDLNVEIANVSRDIGLLQSQDEELQGVVAQGAPNNGPQSSNLGNVFAALSNTLGTAAVVDAESSLPAVEASLSTARARVGYLESLQGSCANNNAPPPAPPPQQAPPQALPSGHADTIINYLTCDGSKWWATWKGNNFFHTPANGGAGHPDSILDYQTWDGSCWQLRWSEKKHQFFHKPLAGGAGHYDTIMNYLTWDGSRWTAKRQDATTFYHFGPQ
jgi:hypothetical protein